LLAASPAAELGAIAALGKMRPATQRLARSTLIAVGIAILGGVASLAWRASATELERDYRLQGWSFDVDARAVADASDDDFTATRDRLVGDRDTVAAVTSYWQTTVPLDGDDTDIVATTAERGELDLALVEGRAAEAPGEVVLGTQLLRKTGLHVGDELELPSKDGTVRTRIVGEAVFPLIGNTAFGTVVLTDPATATSLGADPLNRGFLVDLAPGASADDLQAVAGDAFDVSTPFSPPQVQRLLDAVGTDTVLALFFAAFGIAVFAFGLVTATRRQRLDYAVARAVGFRRRQVVQSFLWHAVITLAVAGVVAVPAGIALGRTVWRVSSQNIGILDAYGVETAGAVLWAGGALAAFTLIAAATAVPLVRATVASGLRAE